MTFWYTHCALVFSQIRNGWHQTIGFMIHVQDPRSRSMYKIHVQDPCSRSMYKIHVQDPCTRSMFKIHVQDPCSQSMYKIHVQDPCTRSMFKIHVQDPCTRYIKLIKDSSGLNTSKSQDIFMLNYHYKWYYNVCIKYWFNPISHSSVCGCNIRMIGCNLVVIYLLLYWWMWQIVTDTCRYNNSYINHNRLTMTLWSRNQIVSKK